MINMFGILATPLSYAMRFIYSLVANYGWTIIIFTVVVRILMIPLSLMQQKSTARMAAYQPMMDEIRKKWANDKNRQNQELQKFYTENNVKMTGGCLPMLINMVVLFGIIAIIQAPLQYMVGMPQDQIQNAVYITAEEDDSIDYEKDKSNYTIQSVVIGAIKDDPQIFIDGVPGDDGKTVSVDAEWVEKVEDFNFNFLGLNLAERPSLAFNRYLIMPILSVLTMLLSQVIVMKTSGSGSGQSKNTMLVMTIAMGVMFGFFAFTVPVGFSLYYTTSNVVMMGQQLLMKRIYDPEKLKEEVRKEIEAKRQMKKAKKVVTVKNKEGLVEQKEMSDTEIARLRLEKARQLDEARYSEEEGEGAVQESSGSGKKGKKGKRKTEPPAQNTAGEKPKEKIENTEENTQPPAEEAREKISESPAAAEEDESREEYKPGRRKRAKMKKESSEAEQEKPSFAEREMAAEQADRDKIQKEEK